MEIKNYTSAINAYRFNAELSEKKVRADKTVKAKNTDKAEFSAAAKSGFADALKAAAKNAADSSASPERLSALSAEIAGGTYNVSAEDVASAIMGL